jgi:hypothetical protein
MVTQTTKQEPIEVEALPSTSSQDISTLQYVAAQVDNHLETCQENVSVNCATLDATEVPDINTPNTGGPNMEAFVSHEDEIETCSRAVVTYNRFTFEVVTHGAFSTFFVRHNHLTLYSERSSVISKI